MYLVKSVAGRLFPELHTDRRAFVGYKHDPEQGENGGFVLSADPVEVPEMQEYAKALRDGDIVPADEATAKKCGLPFGKAKATTDTTTETQKG